jgi:cytochrome c556
LSDLPTVRPISTRANGWTASATARALIAGILALGYALTASAIACAQEQGVAPPKDTIFARKIMMGAIDMNMDEIETMLAPEGKLILSDGTEHADTISIMLMAVPHLFPASTNQWKPNVERDPATDTYAAPELWTNFADFYKRAADASKTALEAARARRAEDFKARINELRAQCNACHALYQKTD